MKDYGFSTDPEMVRVDIFKPSGKWYTTIALKWIGYKDVLIHEAFESSMKIQHPNNWDGMTAVCLDPYHEHSHPLMIVIKGG